MDIARRALSAAVISSFIPAIEAEIGLARRLAGPQTITSAQTPEGFAKPLATSEWPAKLVREENPGAGQRCSPSQEALGASRRCPVKAGSRLQIRQIRRLEFSQGARS